MDHVDHYAESFSPQPGVCFRLVISANEGSRGAPAHCPDPVEFSGRFQDAKGGWHQVEARIDHAGDLTDWRRINASITDIGTGLAAP